MSQHRSLKVDGVGAKHRNVLNRLERIKKLKKEKRWDDEESTVIGMPKVKSQKLKVKSDSPKKEKTEEGGDAAAAEKK